MKGETEERRWNLAWALPASLILHGLIAAFLAYSLPRPSQQPDQEQPINVALVPPPEPPKPKPQPPPQPKEKPPEQKAEKPPPPEKQPPKPPPIAVLEPVFHYGDKDTGPRKSPDGGGDRDNAPPAKDSDSKTPAVPKPADSQPAGPADLEKPATAAADAKPPQGEEKQATEDADKQQADKQEAGAQIAEKQTAVAPTPLGAESDGKVEIPAAAEKPKSKLANALKFRPARLSKSRSKSAGAPSSTSAAVSASPIYAGLPGVRKLYSRGATGDALAASSMTGVSRDQRVANLCGSVLNQELRDASYSPKWLPSIPLKVGNVLSPPEAAFSTTTTWYRLSFRCEVDADATKVLSFNFRVGAEIPPGEWARLRLPSLH